jgi:hypothetical protein
MQFTLARSVQSSNLQLPPVASTGLQCRQAVDDCEKRCGQPGFGTVTFLQCLPAGVLCTCTLQLPASLHIALLRQQPAGRSDRCIMQQDVVL